MPKLEDTKNEYSKLRKNLVWAVHDKPDIIKRMKILESQFSLEELIGSELAAVYKKHGKIPSNP